MSESFSERLGFESPKEVQVQGIDQDLRTSLWNAVGFYLAQVRNSDFDGRYERQLEFMIWTKFLKLPADNQPAHMTMYGDGPGFWDEIRRWYFHKGCPWLKIYEFIEFLARFAQPKHEAYLEERVNEALEDERSAYRLAAGKLVAITNHEELDAIREAAAPSSVALKPVSMQIQRALALLSDKTSPDYRNSMKESISAVESLCKLITGMESATLGPALDKVTKELDLNDDLRDGFKKIYKYTSDDHGIRHGLKDEDHPEQEDARFMLIACSAFVNFVTEKARKLGKLPS